MVNLFHASVSNRLIIKMKIDLLRMLFTSTALSLSSYRAWFSACSKVMTFCCSSLLCSFMVTSSWVTWLEKSQQRHKQREKKRDKMFERGFQWDHVSSSPEGLFVIPGFRAKKYEKECRIASWKALLCEVQTTLCKMFLQLATKIVHTSDNPLQHAIEHYCTISWKTIASGLLALV